MRLNLDNLAYTVGACSKLGTVKSIQDEGPSSLKTGSGNFTLKPLKTKNKFYEPWPKKHQNRHLYLGFPHRLGVLKGFKFMDIPLEPSPTERRVRFKLYWMILYG